jgi:C_GCAxxG_C_C family probable redox protein
MNEQVKTASELYNSGLYCSQAVLGAFCEKYGMDKDLAFKVSCGLNSGVRCADVCGAVSGALLVVGLKYGSDKSICNLKTEEYIRVFKEKNNSIICRDLLGCDISTTDGKEKAISENLFKTRCDDIVKIAAQILDDLGC